MWSSEQVRTDWDGLVQAQSRTAVRSAEANVALQISSDLVDNDADLGERDGRCDPGEHQIHVLGATFRRAHG